MESRQEQKTRDHFECYQVRDVGGRPKMLAVEREEWLDLRFILQDWLVDITCARVMGKKFEDQSV